jgi:hypothetical protein
MVKSPIIGLDTKTHWLTDRQSQRDSDSDSDWGKGKGETSLINPGNYLCVINNMDYWIRGTEGYAWHVKARLRLTFFVRERLINSIYVVKVINYVIDSIFRSQNFFVQNKYESFSRLPKYAGMFGRSCHSYPMLFFSPKIRMYWWTVMDYIVI